MFNSRGNDDAVTVWKVTATVSFTISFGKFGLATRSLGKRRDDFRQNVAAELGYH